MVDSLEDSFGHPTRFLPRPITHIEHTYTTPMHPPVATQISLTADAP